MMASDLSVCTMRSGIYEGWASDVQATSTINLDSGSTHDGFCSLTGVLTLLTMNGRLNGEYYHYVAIYLQVEEEIFVLSRHHFEDFSSYFRDLLASFTDGRGSSVLQPITLKAASLVEFKLLLRVMFPRQPGVLPKLTVQEWIPVLKLATKWKFLGVRKTSIDHLDALLAGREETDAAWRLVLSTQYDIPRWFMPAVISIIKDESFLDRTTIRIIGAECAARIAVVWIQYTRFLESGSDEAKAAMEEPGTNTSRRISFALSDPSSVFSSTTPPYNSPPVSFDFRRVVCEVFATPM